MYSFFIYFDAMILSNIDEIFVKYIIYSMIASYQLLIFIKCNTSIWVYLIRKRDIWHNILLSVMF